MWREIRGAESVCGLHEEYQRQSTAFARPRFKNNPASTGDRGGAAIRKLFETPGLKEQPCRAVSRTDNGRRRALFRARKSPARRGAKAGLLRTVRMVEINV